MQKNEKNIDIDQKKTSSKKVNDIFKGKEFALTFI